MSDLVKRLLEQASVTGLEREAADEIERLEVRLAAADACCKVIAERVAPDASYIELPDIVSEKIERLTRERDEALAQRDKLAFVLHGFAGWWSEVLKRRLDSGPLDFAPDIASNTVRLIREALDETNTAEFGREVDALRGRAEKAGVQLVALREALEKAAGMFRESVDAALDALGGDACDANRAAAELGKQMRERCARLNAILTDTAAAARENERRLRVEGAEAMHAAWKACFDSFGEHRRDPSDPAAVVDAATAAGKWGKP